MEQLLRKTPSGQFGFLRGSGWMYQVDGVYPTHSLPRCFLLDEQSAPRPLHAGLRQDVGQNGGYGLINSYGKEW